MHSSLSDEELMKLIIQGDKDAFAVVYDKYVDPLLHYCGNRVTDKTLSEEIVQEVFISLWTNRHKIHIRVSLKGYLFKACQYKIRSLVRFTKVRQHYAKAAEHLSQHRANVTEEQVNYMSLQEAVRMVLLTMPERQRQVFELSRMQYRSNQYIAKLMNISQRTVENYLSKALRQLRASLQPGK